MGRWDPAVAVWACPSREWTDAMTRRGGIRSAAFVGVVMILVIVGLVAFKDSGGGRATSPIGSATASTRGAGDAVPALDVTPVTNLESGGQVHVHGSGFRSGIDIGIATCSARAVLRARVDDCDLAAVTAARSDTHGDFEADVQVFRFIATSSEPEVDCVSVVGGCILGAANILDYEHRAVTPISFRSARADRPSLRVQEVVRRHRFGIVRITGHGFAQKSQVSVVACVRRDGVVDLELCDYDRGLSVLADADGRIRGQMIVRPIDAGEQIIDCTRLGADCVVTTGRVLHGRLPATAAL